MSKKGAKLKFPRPQDYAGKHQAILCPAVRVLGLYCQNSGDSAVKIAKKVRAWFANEAARQGWAGVHFLKEVPTTAGAGCVLWQPASVVNVNVNVTNQVLVLHAQVDGGGD